MEGEGNQETAVKEVVPTESAPVSDNSSTGKPPAESISAPKPTVEEKSVPYSRFKEVLSRAKAAENSLKSKEPEGKPKPVDPAPVENTEVDAMVNKYSEKLAAGAIDPKIAKTLAATFKEMLEEGTGDIKSFLSKAEQEQSKISREAKAKEEIMEWSESFKKSHPDYQKVEGEMEKVFGKLGEKAQMILASSPDSLEVLYLAAKGSMHEQTVQEEVNKAKNEAYKSQALKESFSSTPGQAVVKDKITPEAVGSMSLADYKANKEGILKALGIKK